MDDRTLVYFANNPDYILEAYANSGEGIDRAGGFAAQVRFWLSLSGYTWLTESRVWVG